MYGGVGGEEPRGSPLSRFRIDVAHHIRRIPRGLQFQFDMGALVADPGSGGGL